MRRMGFRLLLVSGLTAITLYGSAFADYTMREDVRDYIAEVSVEHDFDETQLLDLFADRTQRIHAGVGRILHVADLLGDLFGRCRQPVHGTGRLFGPNGRRPEPAERL